MATRDRFVEVPADALLAKLRELGAKVQEKRGTFRETTQGREIVAEFIPPGGRTMARCYTSLARGQVAVRDCGEDAVRVVVYAMMPSGPKPLTDGQKMLRTAPRKLSQEKRVEAFLERLKSALSLAYRKALFAPSCPKCGAVMAWRETKSKPAREFHGCIRYPECDGLRPLQALPEPTK